MATRLIVIVCVTVIVLLIVSLIPRADTVSSGTLTWRGSTMGTDWSTKISSPIIIKSASGYRAAIERRLAELDAAMSTWKPDSEVSRFNAHTGTDWFAVSRDTAVVVTEALRISEATGGAFDVTVGPVVDLWGFGPDGRRDDEPNDAEIDAAMRHVGWRRLHVRLDPPAIKKDTPGLRIDLSAIAKGYAVDEVSRVLVDMGVGDHLVEVGGELRGRGDSDTHPGWNVAVQTPIAGADIDRVVTLHNASIATSGDYHNFVNRPTGRRDAHIIDPRTGRPAVAERRAASATVVHPSCTTADAWATALLVLDVDAAIALADEHGIAALLIVRKDDGVYEQLPTNAWRLRHEDLTADARR